MTVNRAVPHALTRLFAFLALLLGLGAPAWASYAETARPAYLGMGGATFSNASVDVATGSALFGMTFGSLPSYSRRPITAGFVWKGQDNSPGPFGPGTFMSYDWFLQGTNEGPLELVGPGNKRFYFLTRGIGTDTWIDTRDPEMLGAVLHIPQPPTYGVRNWLVWKDGTIWYFDGYGSKGLQSVYDAHGNVMIYWISRSTGAGTASQIMMSGDYADSYIVVDFTTTWPSPLVTQVAVRCGGGAPTKTWNLAYDGSGRLVTITNPLSGVTGLTWTTYARDDGQTVPLLVSVTKPSGKLLWTNQYDSLGRVTRQTYANGGYTTASYPAGGIGANGTTVVTDPRGGTHQFAFTWPAAVGGHLSGYHLNSTTDALGRTTTFNQTHAGSNLDTQITDYRGRITTLTWDWAKGNLLSKSWTTPASQTATESYTYDANTSSLTSRTDALGRTTTITVNGAGDSVSTTDPRGNVTAATRNGYGDITVLTNALSQNRTMTYGKFGTLLTTTDALSHVTTRVYDGASRLLSVQDANGKLTTYTYDLMDRPLTITRSLNGQANITSYAYDADGHRVQMVDPKSQAWSWSFDTMGYLSQALNPLSQSMFYVYDFAGNPVTITDRAGNQAVMTYDAENRLLTQKFYRVGAILDSTVTYTYNGTTKLLSSITDTAAPGSQTWIYGYDSRDRLVSTISPNGTVTYGLHDKVNRLETLQAGSQGLITYGHDNADNLTSVFQNGATASLTYDALDRLTQESLPATPNPVTTAWAFDAAGFVTSVASLRNGTNLDSHSYTRNAVGGITQEVITGTSSSTATFGYDDLYRLTAATVAGTGYTWAYDAVGNRTSQVVGGVTTTYTVDAADRLTAINGSAVTSDANGCVTNDGSGGLLTWDPRGRLSGLTKAGNSYTFQYGPDNLRSKKTVNGISTTYLLNGRQVVTENINGVLNQTLYGPGRDHPLARNGEFFLPNQLLSTTALTNSAGSVVQSYSYGPFGNLLNSPTDSNPFQFTGRENDGNGLLYYRSRYYNPAWGRFISADPAGFESGVNPYVYAGNNPVNASDPSGRQVVAISVEPLLGTNEGWIPEPSQLLKPSATLDQMARGSTGEPLSRGRAPNSTGRPLWRNPYFNGWGEPWGPMRPVESPQNVPPLPPGPTHFAPNPSDPFKLFRDSGYQPHWTWGDEMPYSLPGGYSSPAADSASGSSQTGTSDNTITVTNPPEASPSPTLPDENAPDPDLPLGSPPVI